MKLFCLITCNSADRGFSNINGYHRKFYSTSEEAKNQLINWASEETGYEKENLKDEINENHYDEYGDLIFNDDHIYFALGDFTHEGKIQEIDIGDIGDIDINILNKIDSLIN